MKKISLGQFVLAFVLFNFFSASVWAMPETAIPIKEKAMRFNNFSYIFLGPGLDPDKDRQKIITDNLTFTTVGIDFKNKEQVIDIAKEMVANGAQMIELCGGFGPIWITKVSKAINYQVPVGGVFYGPEARKPLLDLLSQE